MQVTLGYKVKLFFFLKDRTSQQLDSGIRVFPKCVCLQNPVYEVHVTLLTFVNKIYSCKVCTHS